ASRGFVRSRPAAATVGHEDVPGARGPYLLHPDVMAMSKLVAAALQLCATDDVSANLATCRALAGQAADAGAALCVLPECFAFLGRRDSDKLSLAEAIDAARPGPILSAVMDMATTHRMWVIGGGMPEAVPGPAGAPSGRTYNACVAVSPAGAIAAVYRKLHLFDVDIPGRAVLRESDTTAPGVEAVVVDTPLGRIGLSVCYDLRFPELYRDLVVRRGADILVVPAAFTAHTGAAHWHTLLRARAIENQCYVIAAAQSG